MGEMASMAYEQGIWSETKGWQWQLYLRRFADKFANFLSIVFPVTSEYEQTHTFVICFFGVIFI